MFQRWFARLVSGDYVAMPQDHAQAKLYKRADLQVAKDVTRFARAFHTLGYEQAYYYNSRGEKVLLEW